MPTSLDALKAAIAGGNALLVCGAGVSRAVAGDAAKGWKGLIESAIDAAPNESGQDWRAACKAILSSTDSDLWLSAAEIAQTKLGGCTAGKYRAWLKKSVGGLKAANPALLDAIKDLNCKLATTNYDGLLRARMGAEAKTWRNPNAVAEILKRESSNIWHIHGYWDDSDSVIFSNADYVRVGNSELAQFLQRSAAFTDTLIFIGCSANGLADGNVGKLLDWFDNSWGGLGENHFALISDGEMTAPRWPSAVTPVPYGPMHGALPAFVRSLASVSPFLRPQYSPRVAPAPEPAPPPTRRVPIQKCPRILALGTEWHSGHGGLSTFNRQLCRALAAADAKVICVVLRASPEDEREAKSQGVKLVEARRTPGQPEQEALSRRPRFPEGFTPNVIIGHGRVTGPAAQIIAQDHFPLAQRLHFVHMAPDEIEWFKLDRDDDAGVRAEGRTQIELELGRTAARVIAVGPRIYNRYLTDLYPYNVRSPLRLDPGFDAQSVTARSPPPGAPWKVLLLGRLEDDYLKGLDLAARAVGLASSRRGPRAAPLELVVRGARPDTSTKLQSKLRAWSGYPALSVVVRPFTTDTESLDADIKRASLLLMPSRSEGFGLVGLEAIVAGTPVLVSSESGLGAMLGEILEHEQAGRIVVHMSADDKEDRERWGRAVEGMLRDREAAFRRAMEVRALLATRKTWADAVASLLAELRELLGAPSAPA